MAGTNADGSGTDVAGSHRGVARPAEPGWRQTLAYVRDPFGATERWAALGDVVHVDLFTDDGAYLVTDPAVVNGVLTDHGDAFRKGEVRRKKFARVLGEGVHDAPRDLWEQTQPVVAPYFGRRRVREATDDLYEGVAAAADRVAADAAAGEGPAALDAAAFAERLTLDLLARYVLGADLPAELRELVLRAGELVSAEVRPTYGSLLPGWVPTPRRVRLGRLLDRVDEHVYDRIDGVLEAGEPHEYIEGLREADPELFDREQLRDEFVTIVAAGHRTTATAITAGLGVLAREAEVAERLRADVEALVAAHGSVPDAVRETDVGGRYLGAFVREVLRLYPPSPHIMRDALTDVEVEGVRFPEGATVWMPQLLLHRDPRFWTDPGRFRPDRWLDGDASRDEPSYLPFGAGPRRCLGQYLADAEMNLAFAEVADRFALEPAQPEPIEIAPSLTTVVVGGSDLLVRER